MTLAAPVWLWLSALPAALLLLHLLGRRPRLHRVSSDSLWRELPGRPAGRRRWSPPLPDAALLIGIAILACLTLAAADPWRTTRTPSNAMAVVLDASASMGARVDGTGRTRLDVARRGARGSLRAESAAGTRFLFVAGGADGAGGEGAPVAAGPGASTALDRTLEDARPSTNGVDLGAAVSAAATLVRGAGGGRVVVFSDFAGAFPNAPGPLDLAARLEAVFEREAAPVALEWWAVGGPADNVAVTSLVVSDPSPQDGRRLTTFTLANTGPAAVPVRARVTMGTASSQERVLTLAPGEETIHHAHLPATDGGTVEVRIAPGGALASDDARALRLGAPPSVSVVSSRPLPDALAAAIEAIGGDEAAHRATRVPSSRTSAEVVLVVGEDFPAPAPARWIHLAGTVPATGRPGSPPVLLDFVEDAPGVLDVVQPIAVPADVTPTRPPSGSSPLAWVAGRVALAWVERPDSRGIWCGIPLEATDLATRGLLPLALRGMLEQVVESGRARGWASASVHDADLAPHPPPGARRAGDPAAPEPTSWRPALLALALALLGCEAVRRVRAGARSRAADESATHPAIDDGDGIPPREISATRAASGSGA